MPLRSLSHITLILWIVLPGTLAAQAPDYRSFDNIVPGSTATVVNCFVQDNDGMIWIGSGRGLYAYDGYQTLPFFTPGKKTETRLYCGTMISDKILCIGGDNGMYFFDTQKDTYLPSDVHFPTDVRALLTIGETLWIGSLKGLFLYNLQTATLQRVAEQQLPHRAVYALARSGDDLYVGTYNGLCRHRIGSDRFENIPLPVEAGRSNRFVNSLLTDTLRHRLWIGSEGGLFLYNLQQKTPQQTRLFEDNSIKSMTLDQAGDLVLGTDNGLYILNPETASIHHVVHDSRNDRSLINNIIWGVSTDHDGNVWLGTDNGISLAPGGSTTRYTPISDITGIGDGNQFYTIFRDSKGILWLGGNNGLIRTSGSSDEDSTTCLWYRMSDRQHPLSHNRVRDIYEDHDHNLWVATDGSISRYDYDRQQFIRYTIVDSSGTRNANWAYKLTEDSTGRLWIATYLGGVFVVDKQVLLTSPNHYYIAQHNYSTANGLAGDAVNNLALDLHGNVWVQTYSGSIDRIDSRTGDVQPFTLQDTTDKNTPNYLLRDRQDRIWIGSRGTLYRIDPDTEESQSILFDRSKRSEIFAMADDEQYLWVTTSDGVFAIDKDSLNIHRLPIAERTYTAAYYDDYTGRIWLGCADGVLSFPPEVLQQEVHATQIRLSALYVNNKPLYDYRERSVRHIKRLVLPHNRNNLTFSVSDLNYPSETHNRFVYRLEGIDETWNTLENNNNRITYNNLGFGNYQLSVRTLGPNNHPATEGYDLSIRIRPPWYYSVTARILYTLTLIGLGLWSLAWLRSRNRRKIERIEKEKSLELSNLKMEFFTNVSHEFKTPLSLIIGPVSRLLLREKDSESIQQLELIQHNANKLNSLIHRILEFNHREGDPDAGVIYSQVEFVGFAHSLFSVYEKGTKEKGFRFEFLCDRESIYTEIDVLKTESILNNLISNACKYTEEEGLIRLQITCNDVDRELILEVSDSGIGIPEREIPYVFGRFYQSSATARSKKGTGIGLYLVKKYVELQNGRISISSVSGEGTTVTVTLPLRGGELGVQATARPNPQPSSSSVAPPAVSAPHESPSAGIPHLLIVEDNADIASFIIQTCGKRYHCEVAGNGRVGLEMCLNNHPDLIVADIMMPVMDGLEMCRRIRANLPTATVPIILLTAKDDRHTELESMKLNVNAFIPKPFDPALLLSRIEQLLRTQREMENRVRMEAIATPKAIEAVSDDEKFLAILTGIIEKDIADPDLNVNALSQRSGFGDKQIYRKVKQLTGLSPVEYIKSIRMKKAAMLLAQKKFSVSEVMYLVGFSSNSYFSKCFQREFGQNPRQYAESAHEEQ